jgi:predicted GNAT family acetyltransferase
VGAIDVIDNKDSSRFEIVVDGKVAGFTRYRPKDGQVEFFHTEIDSAYEGQGLGGKLAEGALTAMRERGETIMPTCPFIAGYIRKHPEFEDLVGNGKGPH